MTLVSSKSGKFRLTYKNKIIGYLWLDAQWHWRYSDGFKLNPHISPLFEFPDLDRTYTSEKLFLSMKLRIPPLNRPDIAPIVKKNNIITESDALVFFGKKTITNPFILTWHEDSKLGS